MSEVDFRVINRGDNLASISRVRFKVIDYVYSGLTGFLPPSGTYSLDITGLTEEGKEAEVALSQRVAAGEDDRFVITLGAGIGLGITQWTLEPTLVTSGGLVKGRNIIVQMQGNPDLQPPAAELKKLEPLFGKYTVTADYDRLKWSGTLEIKSAIDGRDVEWVIVIKSEGIDHKFLSLITYDPALKHYRISHFNTVPLMMKKEGIGRFDNSEFIIHELDESNGGKDILRNRVKMISKDEMRIITEIQDAKGKVRQIGVTTGKRVE